MTNKTNDDPLDAIRLLDRRQVAEAVGRSGDTLDDWVRKGRFPPPLQARQGAPKQWRVATVRAWIEKRQRARYVAPTKRGALKRGRQFASEKNTASERKNENG